jgi:hypothetical protein
MAGAEYVTFNGIFSTNIVSVFSDGAIIPEALVYSPYIIESLLHVFWDP